MKWEGNIRKMRTWLDQGAQYALPLPDVLEMGNEIRMNELIGSDIRITFQNAIHCVVSGKKIKKAFGEGMSFEIFQKTPLAVESIIRPELSRIHEGIALRDFDWEQEHHNQPHYVYIALTSGMKVGVTRTSNVPSRWIDQGATQALAFALTPYRQLAGLIEVNLSAHMADKTNWRNMLKNTPINERSITEELELVKSLLHDEFHPYLIENPEIVEIAYPVLQFPEKVNSLKLDSQPLIEAKLLGIKGQYLIFDAGRVMNLRSHAGYRVTIEA
jgi:hypothetical protein